MENSNPIDTQLLNEFYFLIKNNSNLKNYSNYYNSLVEFIKIHSNYFTLDIFKKFRLDVLIKLDPDKYIVDNPSISLQMESQRLFIKYEMIESLAMAIGDTLWDMVTIYSRKDCPNCFDDELRYILIKYLDESERLLLECDTCGWTENIDGSKYKGQIGEVFPAGKKELKKYLT